MSDAQSGPGKNKKLSFSSSLPTIYVTPPKRQDETIIDEDPVRGGQPSSPAEDLANFLGFIAQAMHDELDRERHAGPLNNRSEPPPPNYVPPAQSQPETWQHTGPRGGGAAPQTSFAIYYYLMRTLRNLSHFFFVTSGPRGLLFAGHIPRKTIAIGLFALFLMFVALYKVPSVWEVVFGIFGIF